MPSTTGLCDGPMPRSSRPPITAWGRERLLGQHHRMPRVGGHHRGAEPDVGHLAAGHGNGGQRVVAEDLRRPVAAEACSEASRMLASKRSGVVSNPNSSICMLGQRNGAPARVSGLATETAPGSGERVEELLERLELAAARAGGHQDRRLAASIEPCLDAVAHLAAPSRTASRSTAQSSVIARCSASVSPAAIAVSAASISSIQPACFQ